MFMQTFIFSNSGLAEKTFKSGLSKRGGKEVTATFLALKGHR